LADVLERPSVGELVDEERRRRRRLAHALCSTCDGFTVCGVAIKAATVQFEGTWEWAAARGACVVCVDLTKQCVHRCRACWGEDADG
jgi:hypothetical protein